MGIRGISGFLDPRDLSPAFDPVLRLAVRMKLEFNDEWAYSISYNGVLSAGSYSGGCPGTLLPGGGHPVGANLP